MKTLKLLYQWIFQNLPWRFSVPMIIIAFFYYTMVFPWLVYRGTPWVTGYVADYFRIGPISWDWLHGEEIVSALITLVFVLLGLLLSYGLAGFAYRLWRAQPMKRIEVQNPMPRPSVPGKTSTPDAKDGLFGNYEKIGIILAGGGAKGAYQAGAITAIYEFLEKHGALHKVRMLAGTSIGSWNALFWLAGMVKDPNGGPGLLEKWWKSINVESVIRPAFYLPLRQNYFLSSEPWIETFNAFFVNKKEAHDALLYHINNPNASDALRFYLTRSNVEQAHLEFTTNRTDLSEVAEHLPGRRPRPPVPRGMWTPAKEVKDIRTAVFASMDLPPLFEYSRIGDELFEDGGVVDNLPIRFGTEIEQCDLLFVLPLNASFEENADWRSITKRMFRVMDVRQGVLERNSFKMIYLYNELAALRERTMIPADQVAEGQDESAAARAASRKNKPVQVFSVCPAPELFINTSEFWKTGQAGQAFRLMHESTWAELEKFDFTAKPGWVRVALVGPHGQVTYLEDF